MVINSLFLKHPTWDRGHRRLRFFDNEGPDHINPVSCTSNIKVANISLQWEWEKGRETAVAILTRYGFVDAAAIFAVPDLNMLCPLGDSKIVGVSEKDANSDRSIANTNAEELVVTSNDHNEHADELHDDDITPEIDLEDLLASEAHSLTLKSSLPTASTSDYLEVEHTNGQREIYNKQSVARCALTPQYARKSLERQL